MKQTYDVRIEKFTPLTPPEALKKEIPISDESEKTVLAGRCEIKNILAKKDDRLVVITGPCSVHSEDAALEYAEKLCSLREKVKKSMTLIMRMYFEKPRTTIGWKGLINDPRMDGSCDIMEGIRKARSLLIKITEMGMPTATEILDPITPQYIAGALSWTAIGARTTESQTHREMASGLSMPVGFKNCTDGSLKNAINAMIAASSPQSFLGINPEGRSSIVKTKGNPYTHIVLRGGKRPNYDSVSLAEAVSELNNKDLAGSLIIDCSHANSGKKFHKQKQAWEDVINQKLNGNDSIAGLMLESNLKEGNQKITKDLSELEYGISVTDECISWETTEELILNTHNKLMEKK